MKRGKKLIALLAVFVVLLGAVLLVSHLNPKEDSDSAEKNYSNVVLHLRN